MKNNDSGKKPKAQHRRLLVLLTTLMATFPVDAQPLPPTAAPPGARPPGAGQIPPTGAGVPAHIGRRLNRLPGSASQLQHNRRAYAMHRGKFYLISDDGYVGVSPPLGIRVDSLPDGAQRFGRQSERTYYYDGVYYKRIQGGYEVVSQPR